jgi:2-iminobutanoate/2-iminopropanoate deaminase
VSARAFLTNFEAEYEAFNRVYTEYMGEFLPTRTTIGVVALAAGARVEVDLVAYRD